MHIVTSTVANIAKISPENIRPESTLIGENSLLDSLGLVELCLQLEDAALELGFDFDWSSDAAMSRNKSMFRTVEALTLEFDSQHQSQSI